MQPGNSDKLEAKSLISAGSASKGAPANLSGGSMPKRPTYTSGRYNIGTVGKDTVTAKGPIADKASSSPPWWFLASKPTRPEEIAQSTDQPSLEKTNGGARREIFERSPTYESVDGLAQTSKNIEPLKPVLKKKIDDEPAKKSPKKPKKKAKREARARSVTFIKEPGVTAATPAIQKPEFKPATMTGFTELPARDFLVLLGIWFMRLFIPWVDAWHNFNFYLLREPSYWDPLEKDIRTHEVTAFCVMSVITILVSVLADVVNCRFFIFLLLLLLFVLCPITGSVLNRVLVARAYNQDFYRNWALTSDALFHWAFAIALLVSFPIQLSCIFDQNDTMSRQAHYNWVAVLVLLETVNRYIAFWVVPGKCPTRTFTQTLIWFFIGVIIIIVLLLNANFTHIWAKPGILHSRWYLRNPIKSNEHHNIEVTSKRPKKCIWFSLVLLTLTLTSFVFATLERLKPYEDWDKHSVLSATSMFLLGEIIGTVVMVAVLLAIRRKLQYYYRLPFLRPDVLALGLPHVMNFIALAVLLGRYATLSHLKEGDVIVGPIPGNKTMVVEFYNFDFRNRTVCVHSTSFRPLKIAPRGRATREIYDPGLSRIRFKVTLDPRTTPGLLATDSFQYEEGNMTTFIITLPFSNIKYTDVQALYSKPEIIRVEGTQRLQPKKKPQIYFMNTFVLRNASGNMWMFLVTDGSGFKNEFKYNLRWHTVILEVPRGRLEILYHLVNSTLPPQPVMTTVEAEDYSVWAVLLGHSRNMKKEERLPPRMLKAYKIMETAGPLSEHFPSKAQLQRDVAIMAGMTLAGMASSGLFIGMIYLFWLDTPFVAFRTTCIGVFWVFMQTPVELSKVKFVDIGFEVISALAFLQIVCTVVHFISASKLYSPKFHFRDRLD